MLHRGTIPRLTIRNHSGEGRYDLEEQDKSIMKFFLLFMPVIFSAAAQLLVKGAAKYEITTS